MLPFDSSFIPLPIRLRIISPVGLIGESFSLIVRPLRDLLLLLCTVFLAQDAHHFAELKMILEVTEQR